MSLAAILWALEQAPVDTPSEALVLVTLAERTGGSDGRGAYPSVQWIAERARLQPRQVQNILRKLSEGGLIRPGRQSMVEHIPSDRRPRVWDLNLQLTRGALQYTPDTDDLDGVHSSTERGAITPPNGVHSSAPKPTTNQLQNHSPSADAEDGFDEFWAVYPRKTGKLAAEKAWSKAVKRGSDPAVVIAAVRRYDFPLDRQFIPHPATWLNQGRWLDETPPAAGNGNGGPKLPAAWS